MQWVSVVVNKGLGIYGIFEEDLLTFIVNKMALLKNCKIYFHVRLTQCYFLFSITSYISHFITVLGYKI